MDSVVYYLEKKLNFLSCWPHILISQSRAVTTYGWWAACRYLGLDLRHQRLTGHWNANKTVLFSTTNVTVSKKHTKYYGHIKMWIFSHFGPNSTRSLSFLFPKTFRGLNKSPKTIVKYQKLCSTCSQRPTSPGNTVKKSAYNKFRLSCYHSAVLLIFAVPFSTSLTMFNALWASQDKVRVLNVKCGFALAVINLRVYSS